MLNPLSCYDKFLCFQLDADSPGVQSTSSYQSASTEEEVLIKTHFQIACLLTKYNAWSSTSWALFPRRRWPPAAWCLWSPALVRLTKTTRTTSPQKAFEMSPSYLPENLVRFLSLCFLSVVISVNHLKTNLFQSFQFTYSHRKSFSNFLMWLWIFKWRKRSFVFAPNFPNL